MFCSLALDCLIAGIVAPHPRLRPSCAHPTPYCERENLQTVRQYIYIHMFKGCEYSERNKAPMVVLAMNLCVIYFKRRLCTQSTTTQGIQTKSTTHHFISEITLRLSLSHTLIIIMLGLTLKAYTHATRSMLILFLTLILHIKQKDF